MNRDLILHKIRSGKPKEVALPSLDIQRFSADADMGKSFVSTVESVGGKVVSVRDKAEISYTIQTFFPDAKKIISLVEGIDIGTINSDQIFSAEDLKTLDLVVIEGQFGVAENGASWISDKNFFHRSIPFIASHLVIVLAQEHIVENMHGACNRILGFDEGYGVFISGPSKTADIEQSLVIGAQGALSMTIFVVETRMIS